MAINKVHKGAHLALYRRARDARRSARRIILRLAIGAKLMAALLVSLGLWGVIWLAVSSLASAWPS
jgi:hypothetical protein